MSQAFYLFLGRLHVISAFRILLIQFASLKANVVSIQKQRPSVSILLKPSFTQLGNGRDVSLDLGLVFHWRYWDIVHWRCFSCVVSGPILDFLLVNSSVFLSISSSRSMDFRLIQFSVITIVVWDLLWSAAFQVISRVVSNFTLEYRWASLTWAMTVLSNKWKKRTLLVPLSARSFSVAVA